MITSEEKKKSFDLEESTNLKSIKVFDIFNISKYLKLDEKLTRYAILIEILSILIPPISNLFFFVGL